MRCVARRLEVVAVAGLLWISSRVFGAARLRFFRFIFERIRPAASMRPPCLLHLSASNEDVFFLESKQPHHKEVVFACKAKRPLHVRVRT